MNYLQKIFIFLALFSVLIGFSHSENPSSTQVSLLNSSEQPMRNTRNSQNAENAEQKSVPPADPAWLELQKKIDKTVRRFPGNSGVYIQDLKHGWVIEHNADRAFPSASLIKVPMMVTLFDEQSQGRLSMEETLSLERRFKSSGPGKLKFKRRGSTYTIRDLIHRMVTESDNTAANILADHLGIEYYEQAFHKMGLLHTNFARMIMDLKKRDAGIENWTTPRDMATLLKLMYEKRLPGSTEMIDVLKDQKIRDRLAFSTPSGWTIGNKTGLMRGTCHDIGIVFAPSSDYLICVLTSDLYNLHRSKRFIREIARLTAQHYQGVPQ